MRGPRARHPSSSQVWNKVIAHRALRQGAAELAHMPVRVFLQVASACNLDCYMCSEHLRPPELRHGRGLQTLEREVFDRIAAEVFPHSSHLGLGIGGEPTLSPHFEYFIERAFECGQSISLLTNGTHIGRPALAEQLARCVGRIDVSMDGATKETYERIRLGSRWKSIRGNLERLNEYRLKYPADERSILILCFVLMKSNVHELATFVELAHAFHADGVHAHHVIPVTAEGEQEMLSDEPELYNKHLALAHERARELGVHLDAPGPYGHMAPVASTSAAPAEPAEQHTQTQTPAEPAPAQAADPEARAAAPVPVNLVGHAIPCGLPTTDLFVLYDGRVFPCCHPTAHEKMTVGDLTKESFADIWNNHLYRSLRAGLRCGDVPEVCRTCSIVHDPAPREDPEALRRSPVLSAFYAEREVVGAAPGPLARFERRLHPWALGSTSGARWVRRASMPAYRMATRVNQRRRASVV